MGMLALLSPLSTPTLTGLVIVRIISPLPDIFLSFPVPQSLGGSKKQTAVSLSSTEAEFIASALAGQEGYLAPPYS